MLAIIVISIKLVHFTAYCSQADKVLTKEELLKEVAGKIYLENPNCCSLVEKPWFPDGKWSFFKSRLGNYSMQIDMVYKREKYLVSDIQYPYYKKHLIINQCGHIVESYGMKISEDEYLSHINNTEKINKGK